MTVPMWAPFAVLTVVCAVKPTPSWMRRLAHSLDWVLLGAWLLALAYSVAVWVGILWIAGVV